MAQELLNARLLVDGEHRLPRGDDAVARSLTSNSRSTRPAAAGYEAMDERRAIKVLLRR
jgi:hypothetical protein